MSEDKLTGIDKLTVYTALTGHGRFDDHPRVSQFTGHPLSIDVSVQDEMENALKLVKKMEVQYKDQVMLGPYYNPHFKDVKKAHTSGDPEKFKRALQSLTDSIYAE